MTLEEFIHEAASAEADELETRPMTDHAHLATFGWAWDDPHGVEVDA